MEIDKSRVPAHVAIIMDGNGRWAKAKGQPRTAGHVAGVETVRRITSEAVRMGIKYLTLYTFSTENWNRPAEEVAALMTLVLDNLEDEIFVKNNVRFCVIGDLQRLPEAVRQRLQQTIDNTAHNDAMTMVVALSYSSRWEMTDMMQQMVRDAQAGQLSPQDVTEDYISQHLQTSFMPDPDLMIRTGGELRISNYLLWQSAYTEFYFCDTFWPDFDEECLHQAIAEYQRRQRRYGKTGEQVEEES